MINTACYMVVKDRSEVWIPRNELVLLIPGCLLCRNEVEISCWSKLSRERVLMNSQLRNDLFSRDGTRSLP